MSSVPARPMQGGELIRLLLGFGVDYLRWAILVPAVFAWVFLFAFVLIMVGISFQYEINELLVRGEAWAEARFDLEAFADRAQVIVDDLIAQGWDGVKTWVFRIWAGTALLAYLLGLMRGALLGPWQPLSLRRKLFLVAIPALGCGLVVLISMFWMMLAGAAANGALQMGLAAILVPGLVWMLSAWSLSLSHLLNKVRERLIDPPHPAV